MTAIPISSASFWSEFDSWSCYESLDVVGRAIHWTVAGAFRFTLPAVMSLTARCQVDLVDLAPDATEQRFAAEKRSEVAEASQQEARNQPAPQPGALTPVPAKLALRASVIATVLIVDDEPFMRDVAARALRAAGYQVRIAANGPEAVEALRGDPKSVQLVFLDLLMPKQDGWATLQALRAIRGDLPVLLTSGQAEEDVQGRWQSAQAQGFLPKPYTLETLIRTIERALRGDTM